MATMKHLQLAAAAVGATIEQDAPGIFQLVAPDGKYWFESAGPYLRVDWTDAVGRPESSMKSDAIKDAITRLKGGYIDEPSEV